MPLTEENAKKKRVIAHEKGQYVSQDIKRYIKANYPGGEDKYMADRRIQSDDFWNTSDSLYNQVITGQTNVQPIFESDAYRMVAGDVEDIYDDIVIDLGTTQGRSELFKAFEDLGEGDEFVMMGHSSYGDDPTHGGILLSDMKDSIAEGVNCFLGTCYGDKAGQAAADALGRNVTAQIGSQEWTGAQEAATTIEAFTRPFPGIFEEGDDRSKVYKPTFKLDWAKPTI